MWKTLVEGKNKPKKKQSSRTRRENQEASWRKKWHLTWLLNVWEGVASQRRKQGELVPTEGIANVDLYPWYQNLPG